MAVKNNSKRLGLEKKLQQQFDLDYDDAKVLTDDLLINIETVKKDLLSAVEKERWEHVADASQALIVLGKNLREDELQSAGRKLLEASDGKKKNIEPLIKDLDAFLSSITGGEPDVPIPVLEEDEDEMPEQSDDALFSADSVDSF